MWWWWYISFRFLGRRPLEFEIYEKIKGKKGKKKEEIGANKNRKKIRKTEGKKINVRERKEERERAFISGISPAFLPQIRSRGTDFLACQSS